VSVRAVNEKNRGKVSVTNNMRTGELGTNTVSLFCYVYDGGVHKLKVMVKSCVSGWIF
jgi:hypothetical protein